VVHSATIEKPKLPESFEEDTWKKLQLSVRAVHQQQPVDQSFEELYKAVEDLCIHKLGQNLYNKLAAECEQHIETEIAKLVRSLPSVQLTALLQTRLLSQRVHLQTRAASRLPHDVPLFVH